jgi:hypothetical protein
MLDITIFDKMVIITINEMKGRHVLKVLPALKKLGRIKGLGKIVSKCKKSMDREMSLSFCG